jgi:hypothetical protein
LTFLFSFLTADLLLSSILLDRHPLHLTYHLISIIMGPVNGFTITPHHRQNRRRERPGSRTRRTITRKSNVQFDCSEGLEYARDIDVPLPSDKTRPSPLLRQNFDQSWQRWKAREAEERARAQMDKMQLEREQQRLFGGEVDDDVSLCPSMLNVVLHLFGDIDYIDP